MKSRSVIIVGVILLGMFGGVLGVTHYANVTLKDLHATQVKSTDLLLTWNQAESLSRELFITYHLAPVRERWLGVHERFDADFDAFLNAPMTVEMVADYPEFKNKVDLARMHWTAIRERIQDVGQRLKGYLRVDRDFFSSGNLLVTLGEQRAAGNYPPDLIRLLEDLRWCASLPEDTFAKALNGVGQYVARNIDHQTRRLRINTLFMTVLILVSSGFFFVYRLREMAYSRWASHQYAAKLAIEIEERKNADEMLRTERDKLRGVMNSLGSAGLYIIDAEYAIEFQNDHLTRHFGPRCGNKCHAHYLTGGQQPCPFCRAAEAMQSGQVCQAEFKEGDRTYEFVFSPFADVDGQTKAVVLMRDITEQKTLQAEAMRAGHLASIGELAAGVAHEINNPINGIINYAERLEPYGPKMDAAGDIPARIIREGERIAQIVKNLLSFARDREERAKPTSVAEVLDDALGLVAKQMHNSGILLRTELAPDLPRIQARRHEIQQVFLNLLSNSRYALNRKYPGPDADKRLEIIGRSIVLESKSGVRIEFYDHGSGIPAEIVDKITDPFFSTKPRGEGTGLGLSISHGIIKSHGGRIHFDSDPGQYTRVSIELPVESA